jgi:hypothetical protein
MAGRSATGDSVSLTWRADLTSWLVSHRPFGPAGQTALTLWPGVRLAVDALDPQVPLSAAITGHWSGRVEEAAVDVVAEVFGRPAAEALASGVEGRVPYVAPTAPSPLLGLVALPPDLPDRPLLLADGLSTIYGHRIEQLDDLARRWARSLQAVLAVLPPIDELGATEPERQALRQVAALLATWGPGPQPLFVASVDADGVSLLADVDRDLARALDTWSVELRSDTSFTPGLLLDRTDALARRGPAARAARRRDPTGPFASIEAPETCTVTARAGERQPWATVTVEIEPDAEPGFGDGVFVEVSLDYPDGVCVSRQQVTVKADATPPRPRRSWTGEVPIVKEGTNFLRVRFGRRDPEPFDLAVEQGWKTAGLLRQLLRRGGRPTGAEWRLAGVRWVACADRWQAERDPDREALARAMAVACLRRAGGNDAEVGTQQARLDWLHGRVAWAADYLDSVDRVLDAPDRTVPSRLCAVVSPVLARWAVAQIRKVRGEGGREAATDIGREVEAAVLFLTRSRVTSKERIRTTELLAELLIVLGHANAARLVVEWSADELPDADRDVLRRLVTALPPGD